MNNNNNNIKKLHWSRATQCSQRSSCIQTTPRHLQTQKLQIEGMQSVYQHILQKWALYICSVPSTVTTGFLLDTAVGFLVVSFASFPFSFNSGVYVN